MLYISIGPGGHSNANVNLIILSVSFCATCTYVFKFGKKWCLVDSFSDLQQSCHFLLSPPKSTCLLEMYNKYISIDAFLWARVIFFVLYTWCVPWFLVSFSEVFLLEIERKNHLWHTNKHTHVCARARKFNLSTFCFNSGWHQCTYSSSSTFFLIHWFQGIFCRRSQFLW